LVVVAPSTKLVAQVISGIFLVFHSSFELLNLKGFLWIFEINYFTGFLIVIFINVLVINAMNLIDGIDGLAGIVSIVIFSSFGVIYFFLERFFLLSICIVMVGSLVAYLRFNFSKEQKIFMGDTGSMLIGFLISVMTLRLIAMPISKLVNLDFPLQNIPFLIFSILFVPLIDLLRVFVLRIKEGRSPFSADRLHFHHVILDYTKTSHLNVSLIIGVFNIIMILLFVFAIKHLSQIYLFGLVFFFIVSFFLIINKLKAAVK
jgi:UDP-N-acetylmuramyl pentapeptide phosphotransferase/UDP-N-acetylglucosamine-1-phosphate transferase